MGRVAGAPSTIFVDEFDFSGRTNNAVLNIDNNLPEVSAFSDAGAEFVEGIYNNSSVINGFFDPTDDGYDEQMFGIIGDGAKHFVGIYPGNSAAATNIGYELQGQSGEQERPVEIAGAVLLNVTWQGEGPLVRSTVLANGAVTTTGAVTSSNQNIGATAAGEKFVAIIRVLAVSGAGSITIVVEESTDNGAGDAYAAISGITETFTAVGVSRETTTSATEAWKRVNVTAFSGFSSVTIMVAVGKEAGVS
jgi:hypothetical protein|tara:strand:+ start:7212 stop:7958 length:747 start_codon:yes stop_codon:yes gene_type:complete